MIHILLLILKIVGIAILAVLGLVLLVLALILFVPVFYRVRIIHNPQQTKVTAKVSFLWPAFSAVIRYLKKISFKVKIFGIAVMDSEKPKKEKKPGRKKNKKQEEKKEGEKVLSSDAAPGKEEQKEMPQPEEEPSDIRKGPVKEKKPGLFAKIKAKIQKIRETIRKITTKIKRVIHQKDEALRIFRKPETKSAISFAWDKLKKLLKHVLPKKIKGYIAYGADNPATTGQVIGILSVIYARTGMLLEIRPNFTEKQLETDVLLKGRIQLFTLLLIALKVMLNKELKQVIKEFKAIKDIE